MVPIIRDLLAAAAADLLPDAAAPMGLLSLPLMALPALALRSQ
jgi:hypothetical protein